jgi:L-asparaginase II
MAEVTGGEVLPAGVDGCGVPTFRITVVGLAMAYARLAVDRDLAEVRTTMARFGSLTSDGHRPEARLARWFPGAVKGGAQGCLGVAWYGGIGLAAKAWSGDPDAAMVGIVEALGRLSLLSAHPAQALAELARPPVSGGGEVVGALQPIEESG